MRALWTSSAKVTLKYNGNRTSPGLQHCWTLPKMPIQRPDNSSNFCAALRQIGTNVSPALGYYDTPSVDLTKATPLAGAPSTPIPAGTYDVELKYTSTVSNLCLDGSSTTPSAFVIQVMPETRIVPQWQWNRALPTRTLRTSL